MDAPFAFALSLIAVAGGMVAIGVPLLKSLTLAVEGHREFEGDSMTRREKTRGWIGAVIWALVAIVIWSFFVDWFRAGNIEYAQDAMGWRVQKIIEAIGN